MSNILFQNALQRKPQNIPPIWFMRQAGRYHQHYQALRQKHSFEELCKVPELAAEVAWGPVQEFDFDVAILFSDILFPLEALGFGLKYTEQGPRLGFQLNLETIKKLKPANDVKNFLDFQGQGVRLTREKLPSHKSLVGFVGGLWTLFVYACEGGHAGSLTTAKAHIPLFPKFSEELLLLHEYTIQNQLQAGAEVVMIFDTAAGEISPQLFYDLVVPSLKRLCQKFPQKLGYYSKGTQPVYLESLKSLPWAGLGVDHRWNLPLLQEQKSPGFIQGNFDQALLLTDTNDFKKHLETYLQPWKERSAGERAGWVSGLGHGVLPKTPEAHVKYFVERVRKVMS